MQNTPPATVDHTLPSGRWAFDRDVTTVFDNMLRRSIPQYDVMRRAVFDMARSFVQPATEIVDLGCSRGEALAPFIDRFDTENHYTGVEVSEPMLEAAATGLRRWINAGLVDIRSLDLRSSYPDVAASVTLSVFTMQFIPIEHRQRVMRDVYTHTRPGGAFVLVEKVLGTTAELDRLLVTNYYQMKSEHGYSQEEIERKRLALEGVLVPVTAKWNEELLSMAGFRQIDCFWRWMNFAAWIAVKE